MKRILSFILVLVLCVGVMASCDFGNTPEIEQGPTLDDALEYLTSTYKSDEGKSTSNDYELISKIPVGKVTFDVSWTVDNDAIKITYNEKTKFYDVDIPDVNETEVTYKLTATVKDAAGKTATKEMTRKLPVIKKVSGVSTELEAETAYKIFFNQVSLGKVLFLTGETTGKYLKTDIDPKKGADFYVEVVDGGYKIYTTVNGAKSYIKAWTETAEDGKVSKFVSMDTEGSVWKYKQDVNAWYTVIENVEYSLGTYNTYDTASISELSYYTPDNTGVSQFPIQFIIKAEGEAMAPTEGPKDPTELTSVKDIIALGAAKDHNTYTVEKYLVKGVITEIANATYGNMYVSDAEGNSIYVYVAYNNDGSVRFDALENQPKVGDTVTIMGIVGQYNDTPQMKNVWIMEIEAVPCEWATTLTSDATGHWYACTVDGCTAKKDFAEHTLDWKVTVEAKEFEDGEKVQYCTVCNFVTDTKETIPQTHTHNIGWKVTVEAKEFENGKKIECCLTEGCDYVTGNEEVIPQTHVHTFVQKKDETGHWNECSNAQCAEKKNIASHTFENKTCKDCGFVDTSTHNHTYATEWSTDAEKHWHACTAEAGCKVAKDQAAHTLDWKVTTPAEEFKAGVKSEYCTVCGYLTGKTDTVPQTHTHTYTVKHNDDEHWEECACGDKKTASAHVDADKNGVCDLAGCGASVAVATPGISGNDHITAPVAGTAYQIAMLQAKKDQVLFMTGKMSGHYAGTSVNLVDAKTFYAEASGDGYMFYFLDGQTKNYITIVASGTYTNIGFGDVQDAAVFVYNTEMGVYTISFNNAEFYMGTFNDNTTFGFSNTSYITGDNAANIGKTQYVFYLCEYTCNHEFEYACSDCKHCGLESTTAHTFTNACDADCNVCSTTRTPDVHKDENNDLSCDVCGTAISADGPAAIFEFGDNGDAAHVDGSGLTESTAVYTSGSYTLTLADYTAVYGPSFDAKGNSCIKVGKSSGVGTFTFTVPSDINSVTIKVAKYKSYSDCNKVTVNGTEYTLTKNSNDGEYDEIVIDTSSNKTVTIATVDGAFRCMINTIIWSK